MSAPVKPRDAASLLIFRKSSKLTEILMGRRHRYAAFAPDIYVFPGGAVAAIDRKMAAGLNHNARSSDSADRVRNTALALAALRETYEETGLLLSTTGKPSADTEAACPNSPLTEALAATRQLHYLGRAITPTSYRRRFHARFYVAAYEHFSGTVQEHGELLDLRWVPVTEPANLAMWDVTRFMLEEFQRFMKGKRSVTPLWSYRQDRSLLRYE